MMLIGSHGEEDFVSDFAVDIGGIIGISYDERSTKFLCLHVIFFDEFPMDETSVGTLSMRACFWTLRFPFCDLNSIGMSRHIYWVSLCVSRKITRVNKLRFCNTRS